MPGAAHKSYDTSATRKVNAWARGSCSVRRIGAAPKPCSPPRQTSWRTSCKTWPSTDAASTGAPSTASVILGALRGERSTRSTCRLAPTIRSEAIVTSGAAMVCGAAGATHRRGPVLPNTPGSARCTAPAIRLRTHGASVASVDSQ